MGKQKFSYEEDKVSFWLHFDLPESFFHGEMQCI